MKYTKSIILTMIIVLLASSIPLHVSAANILSYDVKVDVPQGGQVYFNYGKNGLYFLSSDWKEYPDSCKVSTGQTYRFTKFLDRGMIACPEDGYYFAGFFHNNGKKNNLKETKMDILRISVKGIYFYDCFPSKENSAYKRLTKTAYQNQVKLYVKGLYGTKRYKVMDTIVLYSLPKSDGSYVARFQKKELPSLEIPSKIVKTYGNPSFHLVSDISSTFNASFQSSSSKVLTVNKSTGYITIKGPGTAKITCKVKETETTLPATFVTVITVKPAKVKTISAKRTKKKLSVKWSAVNKNSGYEIQVSNNQSFKNIIAKKTVTGGSKNSTTVKLKSEVCNNYVRIRPYKTSAGKRIYNQYTVAEIQ